MKSNFSESSKAIHFGSWNRRYKTISSADLVFHFMESIAESVFI